MEKVVSDTELIIKPRSEFGIDNEKFKIIPRLDQSTVYSSVHEVLYKGGAIGIFPEGGSHDRFQMLPLKAGVAVMALGAMAKYPGLSVQIIPCGLNYFHPDQFRSRVMIEYGKPLNIDPELVEKFKQGGDKKKEACSELLNMVYESLCTVTINVPDPETLQVIQATRRLYKPPGKSISSFEMLELTRRFAQVIFNFVIYLGIYSAKGRSSYNRSKGKSFGIQFTASCAWTERSSG